MLSLYKLPALLVSLVLKFMLTNGQQLYLQGALLIRYNVVVEEKASGKEKDYGHDLVFASRDKYYRALITFATVWTV
jgi:hypothetical protein